MHATYVPSVYLSRDNTGIQLSKAKYIKITSRILYFPERNRNGVIQFHCNRRFS